MRIADLDTPAVIIDVDVMQRNLSRAAAYTRENGLRLRPHTKTHKIPALGRLQLSLGAVGLTVAKTSEAEVMMRADPPELLVAYPLVGSAKTKRLVELANQTRVSVSIDSIDVARAISAAAAEGGVNIGVLLEIDAGLQRVGVTPGEALRQLALEVSGLKGLEFEGLAFYPGHIKQMDPVASVLLAQVDRALQSAICTLSWIGITPEIVSGGSTPALFYSHMLGTMNEIRPGTYIFNDRNTVYAGACSWDDCAVSVLTTVASTSVKDRVILDAGSKTFSSDRTVEPGFGIIVEDPDACFEKMNEEHGFVDIKRSSKRWRVGEKVRVIPNHVCVAMNLQERVYGVSGEEVVEMWEVEARGKLQ